MTPLSRILLPVPPTLNTYWRYAGGRVLLSRTGRRYFERVQLVARAQRVEKVPAGIPCVVTIHWFRARKSGDLDNRCKAVLDALQGIAYANDNQIQELHLYRDDSEPTNPRVEITVTLVERAI